MLQQKSEIFRAQRAKNKSIQKWLSIGCIHQVRSSGENFIFNVSAIFDFRPKQLYAYVEMVSKACNSMLITLKIPKMHPRGLEITLNFTKF